MDQRTPVYDLIARWPTRADLAADLTAITGQHVTVQRVHKWAQLGSIPSGMQRHVVDAAVRRSISITDRDMLDIHATPVSEACPALAGPQTE